MKSGYGNKFALVTASLGHLIGTTYHDGCGPDGISVVQRYLHIRENGFLEGKKIHIRQSRSECRITRYREEEISSIFLAFATCQNTLLRGFPFSDLK